MATIVPSQNEVFLALLAGRAVTALSCLAEHPEIWNDDIEKGLRDGVKFCGYIRVSEGNVEFGADADYSEVFKRLMSPIVPAEDLVSVQEINKTEAYLSCLLAKTCAPAEDALSDAMDFFLKASSGHTLRPRNEQGGLF